MVKPAVYNITAYKGATFRKKIIYYTGGVGSPVFDLSGYTATMPIKDAPNGTILFTLNSPGTIILNADPGTIELTMSVNTINSQTWAQGAYELFVTAPGGDTDVLLRGGFKIVAF